MTAVWNKTSRDDGGHLSVSETHEISILLVSSKNTESLKSHALQGEAKVYSK